MNLNNFISKEQKRFLMSFFYSVLLYVAVYVIAIHFLKMDIETFQNGLIIMLISKVYFFEDKQQELEDAIKSDKDIWMD